jgi:hypothetical protein
MDNLKKRLRQTQLNEQKLDNQHEKEIIFFSKINKIYAQRKKANKAKQFFLNKVNSHFIYLILFDEKFNYKYILLVHSKNRR